MNQANITAESCPVTEAELEAIARYSRRRLTAEEVYTFPLVLCDNDLDRDHECFTRRGAGNAGGAVPRKDRHF